MKTTLWMGMAAAAAALGASAHPHGEQWALANEYPAASMTAEGDARFAKLVADHTRGKLSVVTMPEAKLGYKSREQLQAVADGRIAMATSFGGALGDDEPILALSSLPFVVADLAQAKALYAAARTAYEAAFERHNQKLLFATPWPASGIWTKAPADSPQMLARLHIRTYDKTSTEVFSRLGAAPSVVAFADLAAKLANGEIDAVLSSGDGGAGRTLWERLPYFTAINYAIPLSFTTVNRDKWQALDAETRRAVEEAAAEAEAWQWQAVAGRLEQNYARMRANGMTIATSVSPALWASLREAGRAAAEEWTAQAGAEARALLDRR